MLVCLISAFYFQFNELQLKNFLKLGIELPSPPVAAGLYKPVLIDGNLIYFSGHLPINNDGTMITGKVGADLSVEEGNAAARQVGLNILASVNQALGSLNQVNSVVKLLGMVNSTRRLYPTPTGY